MTVPNDIVIKKLDTGDLPLFLELIRLFKVVFEMKDFVMPPENHLQRLLDRPDFFVFVALTEGKVAGGLTAYTLVQYYSIKPLVYIFDLAVANDLQRRGIGRSLIARLNDYCRQAGMEEVFVQADEVDDHALAFYHATGGTAEKVVHFYYPLSK
jgi:ribosomal protein S18 acetylase RimI-like enzyme